MLIRLLYCPASPDPATLHDFDRLPIVIGPRAGSHLAVPDGVELVLAERAGALVAVRPGRDDVRLEVGGTRQLTPDGAAIVAVTIDLSEGAGSDAAGKLQDMLADLHAATGAAPVPTSHAQMFDEVYRAIKAHHLFIRTLHYETDLPGVAPVDLAQAFGATRTWICQAREFHAQLSKIMGTTDRATILSDVALEQRGRLEGERAIAELDKLRTDLKVALDVQTLSCDGPATDELLLRGVQDMRTIGKDADMRACDYRRWHGVCRDALERVLSRFMSHDEVYEAVGGVGTEVMERAIDGLPTSATITEASAYLAVLARVHEVFDNLQAGRAGRLGGAWRLFEVGWRADMTIDEAHRLLERQRALREGTSARELVPFRRPPSLDVAAVLGKTNDELAAAVEDAASGPFERLRDVMAPTPALTFDADAAMRETVSADAIVGRMVRDLLGVGAGEVVGRVQSLLAAPAAALPCVVTWDDLRPGDLAWYPSRGDGPSLLHVGTHGSAWRQLDGSWWSHADFSGHDPGLAIVLIARGLQEPTPAAPTTVAVTWQEAEPKARDLLRCVSVTAERLGTAVPARPVADHPGKRETNHTTECANKGNPHDDIAETLRQTRQDAAKLEDEVVSLSERNSVLTGLLADVLGVSEAADLTEAAERVIHARSENFNALEEQLRLADSDRNAIQNFLSGLGFNAHTTPFALPEALVAAGTVIRALRGSDRARLRDLCKWVITLPGLPTVLEEQLRAAVWPDHSGACPSPFAAVSTIAMARRLCNLSAEVLGHSGDTSGDDLEFAVAYLERWLPRTLEEKCGRAAAVAVEADRASDARESADLRRHLVPALRLVDELTRERDAESDRRVEVQQTSEQHSAAWSKLVAEIQVALNEQRDLRIAAERALSAKRADVNAALAWLDKVLAFVDKHKDGWTLLPGQDVHGWILNACDQLELDRRGFVAPAAPHGSSGAADA